MAEARRVAALIVAAGRGTRAGGEVPKQYRPLGGVPVLARTISAFVDHPAIDIVQVVIDPADRPRYDACLLTSARIAAPVGGGASRQASVLAGLEALAALAASPDVVLVHDAARPFVSAELIARSCAALPSGTVAAVPGVPLADTVKQVDGVDRVMATPDRSSLRAIQTPQAFDFASLLDAHRRAASVPGLAATDDAAVMEWAGHPVAVFAGDAGNGKLTLPEDFDAAERRLGGVAMTDIRTGQGYDVHAFAPGDHVWLGGIRIPHECGVIAHSDGDVALHAATDALLGAIGDGDIGTHFPPSDPQWRGASSDRFLAHAAALVAARGGRIGNIDLTIVCEAPKIGPHREAIRERIAAIVGISVDRVSIKATTSEKMGFTGRREGLAALALATVILPGG
ncbi:MAG: bifunctional 2-C-methyl-D-erythritol 4-phosphate cytidylyltransferase/2-C-methyl-D-erythritol 2,4-cyclodiphosphate synthase [Phreatobacter sp.]|uniref:bifunctional 2-C-methyl-D-erythritol 4-phosphate cytidylyltransferase/2-C-methyl-D-erythritol 2,4-cyclodiphosphate synthase n=1 Tax=Phreatobacter sp. TaxID=1966341 RepID=UPI001A535C63|nr:bifunctional 2-C-methyl-D-erythritol 4-phosphate cytidylyltransferase/2-C-methyl-D-erythritol 2,4-cyclodiphosphate synthase [Phreatobacter sp.]MBL8569603.1 bifunctional 2-C-methyl-D-erythritol 4-phosphate cytidylyltransferase/2-C-methyl-D-erythritol 2,4-cyclodiphosphate synthase [Phreatobacter sp.]